MSEVLRPSVASKNLFNGHGLRLNNERTAIEVSMGIFRIGNAQSLSLSEIDRRAHLTVYRTSANKVALTKQIIIEISVSG